jgi:hypothetical protein
MSRLPALLLALLAAAPAAAQEITTPSGETVTLFDVVLEPDAALARFRFHAPGISARQFEDVQADFPWLCANLALPALAANDQGVAQVVISMSDRELPLGATDPEAVQYFEGFRIEDAACIWEAY